MLAGFGSPCCFQRQYVALKRRENSATNPFNRWSPNSFGCGGSSPSWVWTELSAGNSRRTMVWLVCGFCDWPLGRICDPNWTNSLVGKGAGRRKLGVKRGYVCFRAARSWLKRDQKRPYALCWRSLAVWEPTTSNQRPLFYGRLHIYPPQRPQSPRQRQPRLPV